MALGFAVFGQCNRDVPAGTHHQGESNRTRGWRLLRSGTNLFARHSELSADGVGCVERRGGWNRPRGVPATYGAHLHCPGGRIESSGTNRVGDESFFIAADVRRLSIVRIE